MKTAKLIFVTCLFILLAASGFAQERVYVDRDGVLRWTRSKEELALFGANYCLPSACDYRAAKKISNDLKKDIDTDMSHFNRMGWDALRVCLWGDFENTDSLGNLIDNEHLDLMDYLISVAGKRGISMLLSPIVTHSSQWPDAMNVPAIGFSTNFKKSELGTNPAAIKAQVNYIRQLLSHKNRYTGIAIKDDPNIILMELINEPHHHPEDLKGSIDYINALVDAVRSTGCKKILFHNYSQDQRIGEAIKGSKVQGATFAWYPTGLNSGRTLTGNFLRTVDEFPPMLNPAILKLPRIVYEFDVPDIYSGYMYPAMARTYRSVGAQFAAMFSYDMLATAPYNLGWQTHFLNMVYTPNKAVSAIIAGEAIRNLPLWKTYGTYPDNTVFGPFRVDYEKELSEMSTNDKFMYSNNTSSVPPNTETLSKIVGCGSSPVVNYEGLGIYFLDKIENGTWRLEVYPDAVMVNNPFAQPNPNKVVSRLIYNHWPMTIALPDLGNKFKVYPLNDGNNYKTQADSGNFTITPGVYILDNGANFDKQTLPKWIGQTKMDEFICNKPEELPVQVNAIANTEYLTNQPIQIKAEIVNKDLPEQVDLYIRRMEKKWDTRAFTMKRVSGYTYMVEIPAGTFGEGWYEYAIGVKINGTQITFPAEVKDSPMEYGFPSNNFWNLKITEPSRPLLLLDPKVDVNKLSFTRIDDEKYWNVNIFDMTSSDESNEPIYKLAFPKGLESVIDDYTFSLNINQKLEARKTELTKAAAIKMRLKSKHPGQELYITLVEEDGTSWSAMVNTDTSWRDIVVPIDQLKISRGVKLPQGYPENWNYWIEPAKGRGGPNDKINLEKVEHLQVSKRASKGNSDTETSFELGKVFLLF